MEPKQTPNNQNIKSLRKQKDYQTSIERYVMKRITSMYPQKYHIINGILLQEIMKDYLLNILNDFPMNENFGKEIEYDDIVSEKSESNELNESFESNESEENDNENEINQNNNQNKETSESYSYSSSYSNSQSYSSSESDENENQNEMKQNNQNNQNVFTEKKPSIKDDDSSFSDEMIFQNKF